MKLYQRTTSDNGLKHTTRGGNLILCSTFTARTRGSGVRPSDFARVDVTLMVDARGDVVVKIDTSEARDMKIRIEGPAPVKTQEVEVCVGQMQGALIDVAAQWEMLDFVFRKRIQEQFSDFSEAIDKAGDVLHTPDKDLSL